MSSRMAPVEFEVRSRSRRASMPTVLEPEVKETPRPEESTAEKYALAEIPAFGERHDASYRRALPPPPTYRKGYCLLHPTQPAGTCSCEVVQTQAISQARAWAVMRARFLKAQETVRELEIRRAIIEEEVPPPPLFFCDVTRKFQSLPCLFRSPLPPPSLPPPSSPLRLLSSVSSPACPQKTVTPLTSPPRLCTATLGKRYAHGSMCNR